MIELYAEVYKISTEHNRSIVRYAIAKPAGQQPEDRYIEMNPAQGTRQRNHLFSIDLEASSMGRVEIHIPKHIDIVGAILWRVTVNFDQSHSIETQFSGEDRFFLVETSQHIPDGTLINVDIENNLNQHFLAFGIMGRSAQQKIQFLIEDNELAIILPSELVDKTKPEEVNHLSFSTLNHHIDFQIPKFVDEARINLNDIYPTLTQSLDYFNAMIYTDPANIVSQDDKGHPTLPSGNIKMKHGRLQDIKNNNL